MDWLSTLQSFAAVARQKNFAKAARELNLPNAVVTKRIQWLERELKVHLFVRTTRKVLITETGELFFNLINPFLKEWLDIYNQMKDFDVEPQGELVVCLPSHLSSLTFFINFFNLFLKNYSKLQLNIITSTKALRLAENKIDILIGTDKYVLDTDLTVGIELFKFKYCCYAAPTFLKKHGEPKDPDDLIKFNCLIFKDDNQWEFENKNYSVQGALKTDSGSTLISAALNGLGLIYLPDFFVKEEVKQKRLKKILNSFTSKNDIMKVYYIKRHYKARKVECFINLIKKHLK